MLLINSLGLIVYVSCITDWLIILACKQFDVAHTGTNIANKLYEIMCDFGIERKVRYVITDGAANMLKGKFFMGFWSFMTFFDSRLNNFDMTEFRTWSCGVFLPIKIIPFWKLEMAKKRGFCFYRFVVVGSNKS